MAAPLSDEQIAEVFALHDEDHDCTLSEEEVERALSADPSQVKRWFLHVDHNEDGVLDLDEFKVFYRAFIEKDEALVRSLKATFYNRVFKKFDRDSDGNLDLEETALALSFMHASGESSPEEVAAFIAAADTDGDGKLSKEEFVAFCTSREA